MVVEKSWVLLNTRCADVCLVDVQQVEREGERAFISVFLITVTEY